MQYDNLPLHHFSSEIQQAVSKENAAGLIFGNFGACNLGDEAILAGELIELKKLSTSLTVISRYPEQVKKIHRVAALSLFKPLQIAAKTFSSDYIILGGGGLFCKNDTGVRGLLFQLYTAILFLYLPLLIRKPLFLLGLGYYENTNALIKHITLPAIKHAKVVAVRDYASLSFFKKSGIKAKLYKDNSFLMPLLSQKLKKQYAYPYAVGLAVNQPKNEADVKKMVEEIVLFINKHAKVATFYFFSLDYHPFYENDKLFAQEIIAHLEKEPAVSYHLVDMDKNPQNIFSLFPAMDFMITSRLHGSIFAHRVNVPFYAISYDTKCTSFLKSIGHQITKTDSVKSHDISRSFTQAIRRISSSNRFQEGTAL
jgi:polysaccharide pyruvyl transferase WcaK-like protein